MPCWTTRSTTTILGRVDAARLEKVAAAMGIEVLRLDSTTGEATLRKLSGYPRTVSSQEVALLKRNYAAATVTDAAKRFGWKVTQQPVSIGTTLQMKIGR